MTSRKKVVLALVFSGLLGTTSQAQESVGPWYVQGDFQGLVSQYSGSLDRDSLMNLGFFIRADYLEKGGLTVGFNRTLLSFKSSTPDIDQDNVFVSGKWNANPDWAPGRVTFRLDGHLISNNDPSNGSAVQVVAPQVSYINHAKTFYMDLGYARSSYDDSVLFAEKLEVDQFTPTLGFGFNNQQDWLQLRGYLIDPSSTERAQGQDDSAALELKWTHWFSGGKVLGLEDIRVSALAGERIFAVDPDGALVYNLVDVQTGGVTLGGEWVLNERNQVLMLLGAERFENRTTSDNYDNGFIYFNFTHKWH